MNIINKKDLLIIAGGPSEDCADKFISVGIRDTDILDSVNGLLAEHETCIKLFNSIVNT